MTSFRRSVSLIVIAGFIHLTLADAFARGPSAGTSGVGSTGGHGSTAAAGVNGAPGVTGPSGHGYGGSTTGDGEGQSNGGGRAAPASNGAGAPFVGYNGPNPRDGGWGQGFGVGRGAPIGPGAPFWAFTGFDSLAGQCGVALQLSDPSTYSNPLDGVADITAQTQMYVERCGCQTQACIADALDAYADALEKAAPKLPAPFRKLPHIVRAAAHKARVAPTVHVAIEALRAAVVVVHKTIDLMRAKDPDESGVATRGGDLVAHTLDTAATALERADTL